MHQQTSSRSSLKSNSKSVHNTKNKRVPLKMVPSTYEPPQEIDPTYPKLYDLKSESTHPDGILYKGIQEQQYFNSSVNNNFEFLKSLIPLSSSLELDEGDCIPLSSDDRWIIASGEVKVVGLNGLNFVRKAGFIFFASLQTKRKIKEVIAMRYTIAYRISHQIFKQRVRNYLFMKNAQKIKYMKYCPFLIWNQSLAEDIAISIDLVENIEKDSEIYQTQSEADYLYFVKDGIVLLQRIGKAGNQVIRDYQKHYESTYLSDQEGLLIVRKGMIFGIDGILIKEKTNTTNSIQQNLNPQNFNNDQQEQVKLKTTRIYTAKAIGKVQIYRLQKNILQTYLKMNEYLKNHPQERTMTNQQLDRICVEYTNILMGSNKISKAIRKKNFNFNFEISDEEANQIMKKRQKVHEIKQTQKKLKKMPHKDNDPKKQQPQDDRIDIFLQKVSPKAKTTKMQKDISLPNINRKNMQHLIMKQLEVKQAKQAQKYIQFKNKIDQQILSKQLKSPKLETIQCMKVKSYRSLLSSMN